MSHRFADNPEDFDDRRWFEEGDSLGGLEVRHIQPYQAVKAYTCPGCHREIPAGLGHEVVVPRDAPHDRRHWHSGCWRQHERTGAQHHPRRR